VSGNRAYDAEDPSGLEVFDVSDDKPVLKGFYNTPAPARGLYALDNPIYVPINDGSECSFLVLEDDSTAVSGKVWNDLNFDTASRKPAGSGPGTSRWSFWTEMVAL
jgi:hypothetical protein